MPFAAVLAAAMAAVGLAAALDWIDWRWILVALCAASVVAPCGYLALRGRLDVFEPLTWFALFFVLFFAFRPAWHLWNENFIYAGRVISPTFTKMLVAGLLAGTGFVIGYLLPAAGSLASRIPRPPRLEPRRLLIWSLVVLAVALVGFAILFVRARGWTDPANFFFGKNEIRFQEVAAKPTATSKYFIASIVLMIPAALFLLSIRQSAGGGGAHRADRRMGRAGLDPGVSA